MAAPALDRYTPDPRAETVERIAQRIEAGELTAAACQAEGIADVTLRRWMRDDSCTLPNGETARDRCMRARSVAADALAEEAVAIATGSSTTVYADAQDRRLAYDALRWLAGKRRPHEYGDKQTVEHTGTVGHLHLDALRSVRATVANTRIDTTLRDTVALPHHVEAGKQDGDGDTPPIETTGIYPGWGDPKAPPSSEGPGLGV